VEFLFAQVSPVTRGILFGGFTHEQDDPISPLNVYWEQSGSQARECTKCLLFCHDHSRDSGFRTKPAERCGSSVD